MILVTKEEKNAVVAAFPQTHVHKTVNHYYCEESPAAMSVIRKMRRRTSKGGAGK